MQDDAGTRTALAPAPARALGADPHDFAGLYIRHRASFTSHARRYLRDSRDAEEVVQEAFLRLFLAMPELETELQALAYCRRTITNLCIDRYRADARRPRLVTLEGAPVDELAEDDTGDPVVRAEDAALVREALSQLPALHRAALVMREIEEKSLPVIADELDVAEDSVKHLLFRARRGLRKLLAGTSVAPGSDGEVARGLRLAHRGASGGVAGLLLLALLGLGSGPDLRAVPVVGVDLPDVLGVTAVAEAVSDAVRDVVAAIVPDRARADAEQDLLDRSASRSAALPVTEGSAPAAAGERAAQPTGSTTAVERRSPGGQPALPSRGRTTRVVTVVDGVPVVTVVPATGGQPANGSGSDDAVTVPVPSNGRESGTSLSTPVGPVLPTGGRDVRAGGPASPVLVPPARPSEPDAPGRSPQADEAAPKAADTAAAKAADRAPGRATDKAAEKAADRTADTAAKVGSAGKNAEKAAQDKADKVAQDKADKVAQDKADKVAQQTAQDTADKAAKAAAGRAEDKAATSRASAERAAARAAEVAAAQATERAAVAAAAAAAQSAPVVQLGAVATTAASAPAP